MHEFGSLSVREVWLLDRYRTTNKYLVPCMSWRVSTFGGGGNVRDLTSTRDKVDS